MVRQNGEIYVLTSINKDNIKSTLKILVDNGIDEDEAETVLQAIGYSLIDTDLEELFD